MKPGNNSVGAATFTAAMIGLVLCGCSHSPALTDTPTPQEGKSHWAVGALLQEAGPPPDTEVAIAGYISHLSLEEIGADLHILTLELREDAPAPLPDPEPIEAQLIDFATPLHDAGRTLQDAAIQDYSGFDRAAIERMAFKLRASASRVRALSQYLQAKRFDALGSATAHVASAYSEIGEAYALISTPAATALVLPDSGSSSLRLTISDGPFESSMLSAGDSLNALAASLVEERDAMLARELLADGALPDLEAAHLLLAYGSMMEGRSWEERGEARFGIANEFARMSAAFSLLGNGLAGMTKGLHAMQENLILREHQPVLENIATAPSLRCAYVGYNEHILADVQQKVAQLGAEATVTVRGRVQRGNFREEVDTLWLQIESVVLDGMTINVTYDDESQSVRKFQDLVSWIGDIDN
ncbi:MAG: hypothetical protein ACI8W8_000881 [Rhodothermales bacterium]|jgi:hypothetical protein